MVEGFMELLKDIRLYEGGFHLFNTWFCFLCCICYTVDQTYRFWLFRYVVTIASMLCSGFRFQRLLRQRSICLIHKD